MYNNVNSGYIRRLLVVIIMMAIVIVGGSFAWFTYQSKQSALVLTIGDINDTQITLSPYQINEVMAPGTTYESGVYSEVKVSKGNTNSTSFALFYKINELDPALIDLGLSYTITNSQTGDVVKTGKFSDLIDTSKQLPDEVVILDTNTVTTLSQNPSGNYKVYLWLDSSVSNQNSVVNSTLDIELNGSIGSVIITGDSVFGHELTTTINDAIVDPTITYTYQWYSNDSNSTIGGTAISGATNSTYIVGSGMAGKYIYVVVTSSNGKTLSDITDSSNDYDPDKACDDFGDGRVERETPIITLSAISGTVEVGSDNSFNVMIDKSEGYELTNGNIESASGTLTAVSALISNVTIKSGASTLITIGEEVSNTVITYHGEVSIGAESNITVTYTPSDTTNVCIVSDSYSVNKEDKTAPAAPTITLTDCDTFTYTADDNVGVTGYYVTMVNSKPTGNERRCTTLGQQLVLKNCWTASTTYGISISSPRTYYVWAKDADGNISDGSNTSLVKITRTEGEGTTLTTRYNSTSSSTGTVYTNSIYVLKNCPIYSSAVANSGYNAITLKHNGTAVTASGTKATVTDAFSVESSATSNTATITVNKDGAAWSNSGMNVALYSGTTLKYAYNIATVSGSTVVWEGVAPGTYNIYAGKNSNAKTELLDSGIDITIGASTSATTAYSATINYYSLTLQKDAGISEVSNGGVSTTDSVQYLYNNSSSSSRQAIAIDATVENGYTWKTWTKVSGTTPSVMTIATKSQSVKMAAGAAVYNATTTYTALPTITRTNNDTNTYTYVAAAGSQYYVSTISAPPSATADTCSESNTLNCWSSNNSYTIDDSNTTALYYVYVKDAAGTVSSNKAQIYAAAPTITVSDYDTFTYSATNAKAYYVTMTDYGDELPENVAATSGFALDKWTTTTSTGNLTLSEGTYYVYAKDATAVTGNISPIRASINSYKITRTQGIGTTLTTKYKSSSGTVFTGDALSLEGGILYAKSVITTGYNTATLQYGDTSLTAGGQTFVVNGAGAIVSGATANKVEITINENGSAAITTGYSVSLSTSSSSDTATFTGTTTGSTISFESGTTALVSGTEYYIWSGKSSNDKTTRIYSGVSFTAAANTTQTAINYYGLTLQKDVGIDAVSNGGVSTTDGDDSILIYYLDHTTASSRQTIAIDATVEYGYTWSAWAKTSGTDLLTFTATTQSQNVKMGAGAVILTAQTTPNPYAISYDACGGTGIPESQTKYHNITLTLSDTIPTKEDYEFLGWATMASGGCSATSAAYKAGGSYTSNAETILYAVWKSTKNEIVFDSNGGMLSSTSYTTSGENSHSISSSGTYKLEVWGAQGGTGMKDGSAAAAGGYGGYSVGDIELTSGSTLYVNVGGQGVAAQDKEAGSVGGYNGGGTGGADSNYNSSGSNEPGSGGGGATHIAVVSGKLSTLENNKDSILIVAGGGAGGGYSYVGGHGGGMSGTIGTNGDGSSVPGTQTSGYAFGLGDDGESFNAGQSGSGGGYYGGDSGTPASGTPGAGGSGYIANSLLSNKVMYCYECTESTVASEKTVSTTNVSETLTANYAKSGDGAARISQLTEIMTISNGVFDSTLPTPTREGYVFKEWNTESDGTGTKITSETIVSLDTGTTVYAVWYSTGTVTLDGQGSILSTTLFEYTGGAQTYPVQSTGTYKLEVWGAQGGTSTRSTNTKCDSEDKNANGMCVGGYGGYSYGDIELTSGELLYVYVGGKGVADNSGSKAGGYNGGGAGYANYNVGSGGGATHIATTSGLLSSLSSSKDSILIVAGGGGGTGADGSYGTTIVGHAGGFKGRRSAAYINDPATVYACRGTQSGCANGTSDDRAKSGSFGKGASSTSSVGGVGAGGGYYGGGVFIYAGSGGSGYIGNSRLIENTRGMYCYRCTTSTDDSTKTFSVTGTGNVASTATAGKVKSGHGAAVISSDVTQFDVVIGLTYDSLPTPTKEGYTFVEWNTKADGSGETITNLSVVDLSLLDSDKKIYAIWSNGAEGSVENPLEINFTSEKYSGTPVELVTVADANGSVYFSTTTELTSSNYSSSGNTSIPTGSCSSTSGCDYTVYWYMPISGVYAAASGTVTGKLYPEEYIITFNANGGTGAPSAQTKYYGITLTLSDIVPTKTNYTFLGWSTDSSATSATWEAGASYSVNPDGDVTLYAVWSVVKPILDTGMIPVKIANDGTVTTVSENDLTWYNYPNKQWANAVLVKESGTQTRTYYKNNTDVTISESDILAYYVWIPRYKYKILTPIIASSDTITLDTIDIVFETANTPKSSGTGVGEYLTHPAFTFGEEELNGFWVGKFESTGSATSPTVLPGITPSYGQTVSAQFATSQLFSASGNIYGLSNTTTDAHMIKNSEWGAVAYLSHSTFGINSEIRLNSYSNTGYGAADEEYGSGMISYPQSTTGNITGVFDMAGGKIEHVMGNYDNLVGDSGFATMPNSKYYDLYEIDNLSLCTISSCAGHALYETTNWYGDAAEFVNEDEPWFRRGGEAGFSGFNEYYQGIFSAEHGMGGDDRSAWRSVLTVSE